MLNIPRNSSDLKNWRVNLGYTQVRAARVLGIGRRTYQSYELGEKELPWLISLACYAISQNPEQIEQIAMTIKYDDEDYYGLLG